MFAKAVPVPDMQHGISLVIRTAGNETVNCGFEGNSDFYGLGIRLGIYLQWITTLLAHLFFDEAIPGNLELNCVFLVAVSAATLVATRADTIRPAECLVLLHLCFGFIFSILSIWGHRIDMKFSLAGSSFRLALATAISAYAVWFWSRGLELLVLDACPTFTFIVVPKAVSEAIGTFYKAQSSVVLAVYSFLLARELFTTFCFFVFCAMASGVFAEFYVAVIQSVRTSSDSRGYHPHRVLRMWVVMTMTAFWAYYNGQKSAGVYWPSLFAYIIPMVDVTIFVWWSAWQLLYLLVTGKSPPPGFPYPPLVSLRLLRNQSEQPAGPEQMQAVFESIRKPMVSSKILFLVNISCLAWAIIAIEITLHWNSVSGIYDIATTGQLIPLIIGIVSILRFLLALTVQSTTQNVTNILLQLFDGKPRVDSVEDGPAGEAGVVNGDFAYPISPRHEAVFWNRTRPRRQSMGTDPKLLEDRPGRVRYQQIFSYDRCLVEYYSNPGSELSSDDEDNSSAVDQASSVYCDPAPSWSRGLRHGFGGPVSSWMRVTRHQYEGPAFSGMRGPRQTFVTSWEGRWEFDNAELDQRTAITLVGYKTGRNFPDTMKRIWVKSAWEDDLDFEVRAGITSVGSGALLKLRVSHTDPSQQPTNHIDRIATGSVDNGSLGPDNLANLPPGQSSDLEAEGGRKTDSTTIPRKRFASLRVLINLFFTALSWIFSEQRILWAFEQYGIILGLSIFGRLWHQVKITLGSQPDKETQSRASSLESAGEEARSSQDQTPENPREHGHWGPHRQPLGTTALDEMRQSYNQDFYSLKYHLESLYGILNLHLQARGLAHCSTALRSIKRLVDDLSQTRQKFFDGGIGLEQQHVRTRTQWYSFLHRLDAVEWARMTETEIKPLLPQDGADHTDDQGHRASQ